MKRCAAFRSTRPWLLLTLLLSGCKPECTYAVRDLDARKIEEWRKTQIESFDKVWQTIHDQHYDPTFGGIDWDGVRTELRPKAEALTSDAEAEKLLNELVGRLKLSHFAIMAPDHESSTKHSAFVPALAEDAPATIVKFGNLPELPLRVFQTKLDKQNVGYFYLSIFLNPPQVMPAFRKAVDGARSADGLIIDLRHNPGGVGVMAIGMGNSLVDKSDLKLGTMIQREGELNFVLNPQAEPYTKPVAILIDDHTGSTAEIFAQGMQDIGRARVFGTKSAGQALPSLIVKLPNGYLFQYAVANYISTNGRTLEGNGVTPDEVIENPKPTDPTDPVIDAAAKWIKSQAEKKQ